MRKQQYKAIVYFIGVVVALTLATQVYWNYRNYQEGKAQLIRDVQTSLNESVDRYYLDQAEQNLIGFSIDESRAISTKTTLDSLTNALKFTANGIFLDSIPPESMSTISVFTGTDIENIDALDHQTLMDSTERRDAIKFFLGDTKVEPNNLAKLTTKIIFSMSTDSLDLEKMDGLIKQDLEQKRLPLTYGITYTDASKKVYTAHENIVSKATLKTTSTSDYMHKNTSLVLSFTNETKTILRRNLAGIILSFLLVASVIASLLYLLKIIQEQKQLAEIKNDFISNMTHEFKTPIATIGVAMESIQHFNKTNDPEKTKKYVDMSSQQVSKLNIMVEKLLDTATLDSEALELNTQETNLYDLLKSIQQKYSSTQDKKITFTSESDQMWLALDAFHIENALDNIVDNAIKYGGNQADIACAKTKSGIHITIADHGNKLLKSQASQIFEKFYRVPKGNTHNVKGFGIGLYYTKTIIEKHNGTINVSTNPTIFKIVLPYV